MYVDITWHDIAYNFNYMIEIKAAQIPVYDGDK